MGECLFVGSAIRDMLGNELINVFHIGSTAERGLKAKPVIDIMPVVQNIGHIDGCSSRFEPLGHEVMGDFGIPGRRYFRKGGDNRTHQIHAFQFDERHLAVRDYLRARGGEGRVRTYQGAPGEGVSRGY